MQTLTIALDPQNSIPMYEQIYQFIRKEIQNGEIPAGERLPSSRTLAACLSVSRSTVDMAYGQLIAEGYMETIPCKGCYVCEIDELYRIPDIQPEMAKEEKPQQLVWRRDFALNGIDREGFPYASWRKISKNVLAADDGTLFQLGDPQGEWELRKAIAAYLHHARGASCKPEQILVGAGNDYLLLLLHIILGSDRKIAMENPTYRSAWQAFARIGYEMCALEPDASGIRPEELEKSGADLAYVMPSHQFPLGTVMPMKRRQQLLAWAAGEERRFLIEDDYDSEFRYKGKPIPCLQGYDSHDKVIYLGTFSKSLAPAIRISYMVLPERLLERYRQRASNFSVTVSRVDQKILEVFLKEGYFERHLNRMRGVYRAKQECLLEELRKLRGICSVQGGAQAGVHLVVEMTNGMTEEEAVCRAKAADIRIYGVSEFCVRPLEKRTSPTILMGYATLSEQEIREGVACLKKVWEGA